jgi:hypothetical protein
MLTHQEGHSSAGTNPPVGLAQAVTGCPSTLVSLAVCFEASLSTWLLRHLLLIMMLPVDNLWYLHRLLILGTSGLMGGWGRSSPWVDGSLGFCSGVRVG